MTTADDQLTFREAQESDLIALVEMLSDDELGQLREDNSTPLNQAYYSAFRAIQCDPNNELIVVEHDDNLAGMFQLTFIPYLTYTGAWRCLIEGVRVHKNMRRSGIGKRMFEWAIHRAGERGCMLVQLTSDKQRPAAIRFYESLGFSASHEGFKLKLDEPENSGDSAK